MDRQQQPPQEDANNNRQKLCQVHQLRPNWFCIEPNCTSQPKFACGDCFLEGPHKGHAPEKLQGYEKIVLRRATDKLPKFKELQQVNEIREKLKKLFSDIRNQVQEELISLEQSIEKQVCSVEHQFYSRSLNEYNNNIKNLKSKLIFLRFVFCEEEQSALSLQLFSSEEFLDAQILKERNKRENICSQFAEHTQNIQTTFQDLQIKLRQLSILFQVKQPNQFNFETFQSKIVLVNEKEKQHSQSVVSITTLPNNRLLSVSEDGVVNLYDESFKIIDRISQENKITKVDTIENSIIFSHNDFSISLFQLLPDQQGYFKQIRQYKGHSNLIVGLKFISPSRFVSGGIDMNLMIWNIESEQALTTRENIHKGTVSCIESLGANKFLSGGEDGHIKVWEGLDPTQTLERHQTQVQRIKLIQGTEIVVSSDQSGSILIWNLSDFQLLKELKQEFEEPLADLVQMSSELFCAIGSNQVIKIFQMNFESNESYSHQLQSTSVIKELQNSSEKIVVANKFDDDLIIGGCADGTLIFIR